MRSTILEGGTSPKLIRMGDLGRGKLAIIRGKSEFAGEVVMRVPTSDQLSYMSLSNLNRDVWSLWNVEKTKVEVLPPGHKMLLEVVQDEE